MLGAVQAAHGPLERCADPAGEVAKNFRVPGHRGTVSFITSMTKAFCSGASDGRGSRHASGMRWRMWGGCHVSRRRAALRDPAPAALCWRCC